ncbi:MAG: acetyl-CoA carboxylase biotin carboxyl carrier protein [Armatimonadota bacterium]|nr:acetyl-CoA carboxylase biotin carboxyl carrier protein [Armatimonadota bacterium]MDR7443712.1 acetyl-CoA carboxylase biotin carboxyl carrier protein [Armatimonadota bacterium]MDR7569909.1 acetyl-CoA carboxylase biotin carboxyl carrier protein [Armatimonadota bacterium]MDR7613760.1 acetyl-CoA carboxylase biotin carboxyl carrier protein [Armatimonadota bacterium]
MNREGALNVEEIRELVRIVSEADIAELEVETGTLRVAIRKGRGNSGFPAPSVPAQPPAETAPEPSPPKWIPITAPMVGTFYRAPAPDAPPFVNEGDRVTAGQTVCLIEAMKMFNEIPAEMSGRVVRILVENGTPVEYGQPLMLIEPDTET